MYICLIWISQSRIMFLSFCFFPMFFFLFKFCIFHCYRFSRTMRQVVSSFFLIHLTNSLICFCRSVFISHYYLLTLSSVFYSSTDCQVQCDKCRKWRRVPSNYNMKYVGKDSTEWFCSMNPDPRYR